MKKNYKLFDSLTRITSGQAFIPEVDFLRFIAIFAVVIYHCNGFIKVKTQNQFPLGHLFNPLITNGNLGVELFFVLSGFILSIPFAKFYFGKSQKQPNLKRFYLRRITRLEPPYIIVMTLLFLAMLLMKPDDKIFYLKSWGASLIYMHNILFHHSSFLTVVAWSLEIEVFFYVSFPLLAKIFKLNKIIRRGMLISLMVLVPFFSKTYINAQFPFILDYIQFFFIGMLLCDIYLNEKGIILNKYLVIFIAVLFICLLFMFHWAGHKYLYISFFPLLIGAFYFLVLSNASRVALFRNKILVIIGGMCYTIYLIHYSTISMIGNLLIRRKFFYTYPFILTTTLICVVLIASIIFYKLVERPFMLLNINFKKSNKQLNQHKLSSRSTINFMKVDPIIDTIEKKSKDIL